MTSHYRAPCSVVPSCRASVVVKCRDLPSSRVGVSKPLSDGQVSTLAGVTVSPDMEEFTLEKMVELGMVAHAAAIADIGDRSGKASGMA